MKNIAQIAIIKPLHNLFDYKIPANMTNIKPGCRVCVEFGKKKIFGFVINIIENYNATNYRLKEIVE